MTFFNKNEDVLKIELTPHGRKLLSIGRLKPAYYAFFDDDIIYNSTHAGFTENNTQTKDRILADTPSSKPQNNYFSLENKSDNLSHFDDSRILLNEIGTNAHSKEKSPSWEINFLHGQLSSSTNYFSSSKNSPINIPQIECEINYTMSLDNNNSYQASLPIIEHAYRTGPKDDGTFIEIRTKDILLNVFERNGFDYKDSFEIEVFIYEEDGTQNRQCTALNNNEEYTLRKLEFLPRKKDIIDGYLIESDVSGIDIDMDILEQATIDNVEYYLDIAVDAEVPRNEVCMAIKEYNSKNPFLDTDYKCEDVPGFTAAPSIYGSSITGADIEDCE